MLPQTRNVVDPIRDRAAWQQLDESDGVVCVVDASGSHHANLIMPETGLDGPVVSVSCSAVQAT
jgi:hypothetical protein